MSPVEAPDFQFNAMLMFGWVADSDHQIRSVNASFKHWLQTYAQHVLDAMESEEGLSIRDFFRKVLKLSEDECDLINRHLREVPECINRIPFRPHLSSTKRLKVETEVYPADHRLLVGVRAMAVGGFPLVSNNLEDRVDVITVCHTKLIDGVWHLTGYQGQLQSAWMRVSPIVREGSKAGAVALMGRNLSHNIGSHALYWLEQDIDDARQTKNRREGDVKDDAEKLGRLYRYLRERMELLAGFATFLPLSPRTVPLKTLIDEFQENTALTSRLCRSEGVTGIVLNLRTADPHLRVSIPGGAVGIQAFHSILENIIRDCAKYGNPPATMDVAISVDEPEGSHAEDLLRVRVSDMCGACADPEQSERVENARVRIREALDELRIADEDGFLIPGFWGVKERFIAAALLRGYRVEDLVPSVTVKTQDEEPASWNLNHARSGEPRILDLVSVDGAIGWEFYLLKSKEVLVVGGERHPDHKEEFDHRDMRWLHRNIDRASAITHRFAVLLPAKAEDLDWILDHREFFPFRTFLGGGLITDEQAAGKYVGRLDSGTADKFAFEPDDLARQWLLRIDPALSGRFILLKTSLECLRADWDGEGWVEVDDRGRFYSLLNDPACMGMFHRHWDDFARWYTPGVYSEVFSGIDSLVRLTQQGPDLALKHMLFESAAIRVLLVDERMDKLVDAAERDHTAPVTIRQRLAMMGITVRGSEYSGRSIPDQEELLRWAMEHGAGHYHFISIHRGVLDKLERLWAREPEEICESLRSVTPNLLVHSGRAGSAALVKGVKHIPLSNVSAWLDGGRRKLEIVDELCLVRRTS